MYSMGNTEKNIVITLYYINSNRLNISWSIGTPNNYVVYLELMQSCRSVILQLKKKKTDLIHFKQRKNTFL